MYSFYSKDYETIWLSSCGVRRGAYYTERCSGPSNWEELEDFPGDFNVN